MAGQKKELFEVLRRTSAGERYVYHPAHPQTPEVWGAQHQNMESPTPSPVEEQQPEPEVMPVMEALEEIDLITEEQNQIVGVSQPEEMMADIQPAETHDVPEISLAPEIEEATVLPEIDMSPLPDTDISEAEIPMAEKIPASQQPKTFPQKLEEVAALKKVHEPAPAPQSKPQPAAVAHSTSTAASSTATAVKTTVPAPAPHLPKNNSYNFQYKPNPPVDGLPFGDKEFRISYDMAVLGSLVMTLLLVFSFIFGWKIGHGSGSADTKDKNGDIVDANLNNMNLPQNANQNNQNNTGNQNGNTGTNTNNGNGNTEQTPSVNLPSTVRALQIATLFPHNEQHEKDAKECVEFLKKSGLTTAFYRVDRRRISIFAFAAPVRGAEETQEQANERQKFEKDAEQKVRELKRFVPGSRSTITFSGNFVLHPKLDIK